MLKMLEKGIPKEDLELINRAFSRKDGAQIITKDHSGSRVHSGRRLINPHSFLLESFVGKVLKYPKWVHKNGQQILVGEKGTRWEDIPEALRNEIAWFESDFES